MLGRLWACGLSLWVGRAAPAAITLVGPFARDTARAMSQENVEIVRRLYADPRGLTSATNELVAPEAEFDFTAVYPDRPILCPASGHENYVTSLDLSLLRHAGPVRLLLVVLDRVGVAHRSVVRIEAEFLTFPRCRSKSQQGFGLIGF